MAGVVDRFRKKPRGGGGGGGATAPQQGADWTTSGSFINKPQRGWLHPDDQLLPDAGVCYGVRYIGCMVVKQSMKSLDFDTRTALAKESISRVCDAAGLKTPTKKAKKSSKISKLLNDEPNLIYAGSNVNLTITTETLHLMVMESGEIIASHEMPGISFASGGDPDTMDFVAYVAKDRLNGRACFVLECGGGLAQDVITTIGQAFELRYKQYLAARPEAYNPQDSSTSRLENSFTSNNFNNGGTEKWSDEKDYYNDHPGAQPPFPEEGAVAQDNVYASPKSNQPVPDSAYMPPEQSKSTIVSNLIDLNTENSLNGLEGAVGGAERVEPQTNGDNELDAFDMKPFNTSLPTSDDSLSPVNEPWYHGQLSRQQTELRMKADGDFLVRESVNSPGQYVLSGMHNGRIRHLLLVDPQGVVRTKDRTFQSVRHLINYHLENKIPIVSQDSELALENPMLRAL